MIREYTEEEKLKIRDRRMKHAELIEKNCPTLCWTDIIMWAWSHEPGYHGMTVELDRAEDCRVESEEYRTCYCHRFVDGVDQMKEVENVTR